MMKTTLAQKNNYTTSIPYIQGSIREYDIRAANINTLLDAGFIKQDTYDYLVRLPKEYREDYVGRTIADDRKVYDIIHDGIIRAKTQLFLQNHIKDEEVIRIANDAVFVWRSQPLSFTSFGDHVQFVHKGTYTSFMRIGINSIFFNGSDFEHLQIEVIGMKKVLYLHSDGFLTFLVSILYMLEKAPIEEVISAFNRYYNQYMSRELHFEHYREFNAESNFRIGCNGNFNNSWSFGNFPGDIQCLDISYNAMLLREIYQIILSVWKQQGAGR